MTSAPAQVLESVLYAADLDAAERFYGDVLGLERVAGNPAGRCSSAAAPGTVLVFNPAVTGVGDGSRADCRPAAWRNGSRPCLLRADADELDLWRRKFGVIRPRDRGRIRMAAGRPFDLCPRPRRQRIEFAEPRIWGACDKPCLVPGDELVVAPTIPASSARSRSCCGRSASSWFRQRRSIWPSRTRPARPLRPMR